MFVKKIVMSKPDIGFRERIAVDKVMRSGMLAQNKNVSKFEQEFSHLVDGLECIAVNSGTSALHLMLLGHGIGPGDEVIVPSFTFAATANAVALTGATPVFADVDPETFCITSEEILRLITAKTKAVMPVHLFGNMADMPAIAALTKSRGLLLFEDAAQAHLAAHSGKAAGTWGDGAAFSFYPTKNMTTGEGGMVVLKDSEIARRVRMLRNQGMAIRYQNELVGLNNRMTEINAAIGLQQLRKLSSFTAKRRSIARLYSEGLEIGLVPKVEEDVCHVFHQFNLLVPESIRDSFRAHLLNVGIPTDVYYPIPVHMLPSFHKSLHLPVTEQLTKNSLALPMHAKLTKSQIRKIIRAANSFAESITNA